MDVEFQIDELNALVARALLAGDYQAPASARVRAVPDVRAIRYYTTLGLLSPPTSMRGRTAQYGRLHVLQLVSIKRLQGKNLTLSDIQRRLTGLPAKKLEAIAKLPEGFWDEAAGFLEARKLKAEGSAEDAGEDSEFWLTPAECSVLAPLPAASPVIAIDANGNAELRTEIRLNLPGNVTLRIEIEGDARSMLSTLDPEALVKAAQPLIKELERHKPKAE